MLLIFLQYFLFLGFDVETIEVPSKGFMCTIWSLAGNPETRVLWKEFVVCAQAIIFVLDATDNLNFHIVKEELHTLAKNPHLQDSVFLILVNKIDQIDVFDINFIAHSISFDDIPQQKRIFGVSVRRREGIQEAMGWLADKITSKHQKQIFSWWNYFRFGSIIH